MDFHQISRDLTILTRFGVFEHICVYLPWEAIFSIFWPPDPIPDPGTRFQTPASDSRPRSQISDPRPLNLRTAIINSQTSIIDFKTPLPISKPSPIPDHKSQIRDHKSRPRDHKSRPDHQIPDSPNLSETRSKKLQKSEARVSKISRMVIHRF